MRTEAPYWHWPLDRWKLLAALLLILALLVIVLSGRAMSVQAATPVLTRPVAGAQLSVGALGEAAGTADPRARIQVFDGDRLLANTSADALGEWRFLLPALPAGDHTFTVRVVGADGAVLATSQPVHFTVGQP